jgi:hypothetical protein
MDLSQVPANMTKALIFDLDSCLSAADEPGQQLYASAFDTITRANQGLLSPSVIQNAFADMWRLPFDFVAKKYGFTPEISPASPPHRHRPQRHLFNEERHAVGLILRPQHVKQRQLMFEGGHRQPGGAPQLGIVNDGFVVAR